jgi:hypothetical protein
MPGGRNPYTRPANKPERAAMQRQSARNKALANIKSRREENIDADNTVNEFTRDLDRLIAMESQIRGAGSEDRQTLDNMKQKARRRKRDMFKMNKGGAVPSNRKGFSMLPEEVQMKMDPEEAMKYMEGGAVKPYKYGGKVKKYQGGGKVRGYKDGGGVCRGGGAAISGTKFSGVK